MKIFVNAISVAEGGGLVVLKQLIEKISAIAPEINWYVAAQPNVLAQLPQIEAIKPLPYSWAKKSPLHHLFWYEVTLPKLISKSKIDLCFSQTNFLSRRRLACPSLLLIQHAGYFSAKFNSLYLHWYKKKLTNFVWEQKIKWVHQSIKHATAITVQTIALAKNIVEQVGIHNEKIVVIPHGTGSINSTSYEPKLFPHTAIWRIGYITKFGVQKDFTTVMKAVSLLKSKGIDVKLILTLNEENAEFAVIRKQIRHYGIEDSIENHGEVADPEKIRQLYDSLHLFVFSSLCESFGFTLVEAMATGLPLVVADTPSNLEVVDYAGEKYPAEDEMQLAEKIQRLLGDEQIYTKASKSSLERASFFSWDKTAKNLLILMRRLTNSKGDTNQE